MSDYHDMKYGRGALLHAADISDATFTNWFMRYNLVFRITPEERAKQLETGRLHFSRARIYHVAVVARLVKLGIMPSVAHQATLPLFGYNNDEITTPVGSIALGLMDQMISPMRVAVVRTERVILEIRHDVIIVNLSDAFARADASLAR